MAFDLKHCIFFVRNAKLEKLFTQCEFRGGVGYVRRGILSGPGPFPAMGGAVKIAGAETAGVFRAPAGVGGVPRITASTIEVDVQSRQLIVLATRNSGKTIEIQELLQGFPVTIKNLKDFGSIPVIEEDGATFDDNAYKKASLTAKYLGLPALADDSGLVVDALDGAPGVLSARFGGPDATDGQRCRKLLDALAGKTSREAHFACVISLAVPSGAALTYEGRCDGVITEEPRGANGFGYDPIFFYPPLQKTFAQLSLAEKNKISHRAQALMELRAEFDKVLVWIRNHLPQPPPAGCMGGEADIDVDG